MRAPQIPHRAATAAAWLRIALVGMTLFALAAGCSDKGATNSNTNTNGGSAAKNPCALVSGAELATVVAQVDKLSTPPQLTKTNEVGEFQGRTCGWTYPHQETLTDTGEISITAWRGLQYYTPDAVDGFTPVPGIGDAAHVSASMFMFRKGDDVFLVSVHGDSNSEALRPAIAKLVVTKL